MTEGVARKGPLSLARARFGRALAGVKTRDSGVRGLHRTHGSPGFKACDGPTLNTGWLPFEEPPAFITSSIIL